MSPDKITGQPEQKVQTNRKILMIIIAVVTLFVLIVVLLATVAFKTLISAREKARRSSALAKASEMVNPVNVCVEGGGEVKNIKEESYVCSDMGLLEKENTAPGKWSVLPEGHSYGKFVVLGKNEWEFTIEHDEDGKVVECDQDGCKKLED